jgi:hypothetical protein
MKRKDTIEKLENDVWQEPSTFPTELVKSIFALRKKSLDQLTSNDTRLLLTQNVGLKYVVPIAIKVLKADLLHEALYYPGDLLSAVLNVENAYWDVNQLEKEELRVLLERFELLVMSNHLSDEVEKELTDAVNKFNSRYSGNKD